MYRSINSVILLLAVGLLMSCSPGPAEDEARSVIATLEDYQRAEQFLPPNANPLVTDRILRQYWQAGDRLVYRKSVEGGSEILIADSLTGRKTTIFDPINLANAIGEITGDTPDSADLDLRNIEVSENLDVLSFTYEGEDYRLETAGFSLQKLQEAPHNEFLSPDESKAAFIRDHNLWLRDTLTDAVTQLTFDGVENYGYATNNAGWLRDDGPVLLWSPDSQKIATFRHDSRKVGDMYLVTTEVGHSTLDAWKYPLPG
ncbi:MAG: DPP IV N-terminal domain-containing protein, partial [Pseudomonadota bacterium]|nr:DPP IV N-terminal domain-containing protein [Pseudomonadota bacterium]